MKRTWLVLLSVVVVVATCFVFSYDSRPDFVVRAEPRLSSYLSVSHGSGVCEAKRNAGDEWTIKCKQRDGMVFEYALLPPEKSPVDTAYGFYLIALNDSARKSAEEDLTKYLKIGTNGINNRSS